MTAEYIEAEKWVWQSTPSIISDAESRDRFLNHMAGDLGLDDVGRERLGQWYDASRQERKAKSWLIDSLPIMPSEPLSTRAPLPSR